MFSADGTVRPIYNRQKTISLSVNAYPGMTGVGYEVNHYTGAWQYPGESTTYYHGDHLGSARTMTNDNGYPLWSATFLPFGQEWNPQITMNNYKFTGDERDAESQLDHTWFRQYSSSLGRWTSPDPADLAAVNPSFPQSWNRYAYVDDDPTDLIDPLGLFTIGPCGVDGSLCDGGPTYPVPGQCYDLLLDGISIGNNCNIIGPGPILRRKPGGGPTMSPAPPVTPCQITDAFLGALEFTGKLGPEGQFGPLKLGASLYKNFSTGDTGGVADASAGVVGFQLDNPTPQGGNLGGTTEGSQLKFSALGFQKNLTTGAPTTFSPSKNIFRFGIQVGVGLELGFNSDKFNDISRQNDACRAQGGG
jgi:RHS repeat-associated protein